MPKPKPKAGSKAQGRLVTYAVTSWTVHRYCAGVTCKHYAKLTTDTEPFTCKYCMLRAYKAMVVQLQSDVENLKSELASMKAALQARTPEGRAEGRAEDKPTEGAPLSYAEAMSGRGKKPPQPTTTPRTQPQPRSVSDNKFSIVLYGVNECPPGSPRSTRLESDITSVVSVFPTLDGTIQAQFHQGMLPSWKV